MGLKQRFVVLALALSLALAGCSSVQPGESGLSTEDLTAAEIGEQVQQKHAQIDEYTATVTTEIVTDGETRRTTADVWVDQSSGAMRYEYVEPAGKAGTVVVSNGSTTWFYDASANTVRRTDLGSLRSAGTTGAAGAAMDYERLVEDMLERFDVRFDGTATVDGRETYVLELTPKADAGGGIASLGNQTLWVDKESWFPVKRHVVSSFGDRSVELTTTYSDLDLDAEIPTERFAFEPPADAEVVEAETPETASYDSVSAAEESVDFDVVEPATLPDGFELASVTTSTTGGQTLVSQVYSNGTAELRVSQSTVTGTDAPPGDAVENVSIAGQEGSYVELGPNRLLRWTCADRSYTVTGPLSKADLVGVAESMACA